MDKPDEKAGFMQVPRLLRALVRVDEVWLVLLAAGVGILAGFGVALMNEISFLMHQNLFALALSLIHISEPTRPY